VSRSPGLDRYLAELSAGLPALGRLRSRVLAETEDHLRDDIAARMRAGDSAATAQQAALIAFGSPADLARNVAEGMAQSTARRMFSLGIALFAIVIVGSDLATTDFAHLTASWLSDGPGTVFTWIVAQVALVAGAVTVIRAIAHSVSRTGISQLFIVRGMLVVIICAALALAVDAAGAIGGPLKLGVAGVALVIAALAASLTAAAAAMILARRTAACLRSLGIGPEPDTTIIDDIRAAATRVSGATQRLAPATTPLLRGLTRITDACVITISRRAPWLAGWLDVRRHSWRFAVLAMAPLGILTFVYGVVQGLLTGAFDAGVATMAYPLELTAIECGLALTGYAMLGRYLALRQG
jgi:hypothetical protein